MIWAPDSGGISLSDAEDRTVSYLAEILREIICIYET